MRLNNSPTRRRLECWLVFACLEHVIEIDAVRLLLERDEALRQNWSKQRQNWSEQRCRALAWRHWERPAPLAIGADAKTLHEQALAWAATRA